ncbi:MAG: hypothetical protein Q9191_004303 [Dirinaria sp. TL-2023a]
MASEKAVATSKRDRSPVSPQRSSSPAADRAQVSPSSASLEDYVDSPKDRPRDGSLVSHGGRPRLPSISKAWPAESPSDICLCQPDPKVPRPRNAFILYRQHYQAAVVAQNPGLANPEISKVIGEQWRDSSIEVKNHWRSLADEEKLRHQKQHPNYRYQPRRSGRNNSLSSPPASGGEIPRCTKCGRKAITPGIPTSSPFLSNPGTPYTPSLSHQSPHSSAPSSAPHRPRQLQLTSSPHVNGPPSAGFRPAPGMGSPRGKRPSLGGPLSPDPKRRRPNPVPGYGLGIRNANGPRTPFYPPPSPSGRRDSLPFPHPGAVYLPHPQTGNRGADFAMGPPPRPMHAHSHSFQDENLRLPPIQTHIAHLKEHEASASQSQAKSVKAMVMSINAINKIRVLAKIAPPADTAERRGVVIAVEAQDAKVVQQVTDSLRDTLAEAGRIQTFSLSEAKSGLGEKDGDGEATYPEYLSAIQCGHHLSGVLRDFINGVPSPTTSEAAERAHRYSSPVSPKTVPAPKTRSSQRAANEAAEAEWKKSGKGIPIAILPRYQLSLSDTYACSVPITDAYSPADHWQWMATLWRGSVGPDITIAVRSAVPETPTSSDMGKSGGKNGKSGVTGTVPSVEVRIDDARTILVRVGEDGEVTEGSLRRVGFEVGEWVRSFSKVGEE